MKVTLVHPYRHHAYNTVKALKDIECELEVFFGYYNKNSKFNNIIRKFDEYKFISKFLGYNDKEIDDYVKINYLSQILFLLTKFKNNSITTQMFLNNFQKNTLKKVKDKDVYIFLQNYCKDILDYAYENNKIIVYDHIYPAGIKQRELLLKEVEMNNFPLEYVDKFLSKQEIESNYDNIRKANIILNASNSSYEITKEVLGEERAKEVSFVVPYGVNFEHMEETQFNKYIESKYSNIKNRKLKILYVGSISLAKGISYLIDIIDKLQDFDVEFGIIGLPNKEEDIILVKKLCSYKNTTYYGSVPHLKIKKIYKEYDLFIFTSILEGFGMVTLEAMSMGLPCIVNKYCSSIIKQNYDGFITSNVNSIEYIKIIKNILNDIDMLREMSYRAYYSSKKYTWERYRHSIIELFNNTMR